MERVVVTHPSPDLYGSDRMLVESVRALSEVAEVTVVLPAEGPLCDRLRETGSEIVIMPTPVLRKSLLSPLGLLTLGRQTLSTLPRMVALLRRARPTALYVSTITIPLWIVAGRLARVHVVCHAHEAEQNISPLLQRLLTAPVRLAHHVVANSEACLRTLTGAGVRPDRVTVIYNGVPDRGDATLPRDVPEGRLAVVGRLSPRKGSDVAVRAAALLRERGRRVTLTLVGAVFPGYEWFEEELRGLAGEEVVFAGFQDPITPFLADADIVLVPSREEPFGNVAVEGMLAGRPVVASEAQGLREIIRNDETGVLVPPGEPEVLADAIEALLDDWPHACALARAGQKSARERFDPARYHSGIVRALGVPLIAV
ncbi:glycosyltransferase family 4 protein [Microtetraspora sp. NBRC 16547]|uniref:glycosyltransferase family 4 protein n=1 Tax=Microtetraspora sp. NBRC 16547 TaxID=3030993 RepID=UPI0024A1F0F5|nr:glycosyltransferase family 4 protein [Microtetraspora sp. NBRC 16547]GLW99541.1 glycosyl transferase [Microtetraspora sp. NBRC 16547]